VPVRPLAPVRPSSELPAVAFAVLVRGVLDVAHGNGASVGNVTRMPATFCGKGRDPAGMAGDSKPHLIVSDPVRGRFAQRSAAHTSSRT
jgi:hypothetical protein